MIATLVAFALSGSFLAAQDRAPLIRWILDETRIVEGQLRAVNGPDPQVSGFPKPVQSPWGPAMEVNYELDTVVLPWFVRREWDKDPKVDFSVTVAFRGLENKLGQRLAGCIFNMPLTAPGRRGMVGWEIRIDNGRPTFYVGHPGGSSEISAPNSLLNKWSWITVGYTGKEIWMVLDGEFVRRTTADFGPLPYSGRSPIAVSGYWHGHGSAKFRGEVREFRVDSPALVPEEAVALHRAPAPVPALEPLPERSGKLDWVIAPFLQSPRPGGMTLSFETSTPTTAIVWHGPHPNEMARTVRLPRQTLHHARLENLPHGEPWFYRLEVEDRNGAKLSQETTDFRTLPGRGQTLRFVATADTQASPDRTVKVAEAMLEHRPDFVTVVGDLVGEGWLKQNWSEHFFLSMRKLLARVPLVPVLGNHERNARLYYLLFDSPPPKFHYRLSAGPVDLFVLDTEHPTDRTSSQFRWLERELRRSRAPWKIAMHHYPAYSSGYDTLGDLTDFGGDSQARNLVPLYDRYGVNAVFAGHVHHYERTFPLRNSRVDPKGITYFTVGGGGGGLDRNSPAWRFDFSQNRRSAHHFALVTASDRTLDVQVYDWDNHLFDQWNRVR